ncbi:hypothetical protein E2J97_16910 [Vibrio cholerae]|nr:hypothetical protein [Vibrio cholerae]
MNLSIKTAFNASDVPDKGYQPYTAAQKSQWARDNAKENAQFLTQKLGFEVSDRLPFILLQAAADVLRSIQDRKILKTKICHRSEHYANAMKVLAVALLHYDLAANLVATRDKTTRKLIRCENSLYSQLLGMASRTVDNAIYTLKRSGFYLSFEQREEKEGEWRGSASIKRINAALFEMLGLGQLASAQRAKAKQRVELRRLQKTPIEQQFDEYRRADDKVREKRNKQRAEGRKRRLAALNAQQSQNRTSEILDAIASGMSPDEARRFFMQQDCPDIPY